MKKTLTSLVLGTACLLGINANAQTQVSETIVNPICVSNPSIAINKIDNGRFLTYSTGDSLLLNYSKDGKENTYTLRTGGTNYGNIDSVLDNNGNDRIVFSGYEDGKWKNFYVNTIDSKVKTLYSGSTENRTSVAYDNSQHKLYVAAGNYHIDNPDIVVASSTDYFKSVQGYWSINLPGVQKNPVIRCSSNPNPRGLNEAHLIFENYVGVAENGTPKINLEYTTSGFNFGEFGSFVINPNANQTYGADMVVDGDGHPSIAYKSSQFNPDNLKTGDVFVGSPFGNGKRVTTNSVNWAEDRPLSFAMDEQVGPLISKDYISWGEWNNDSINVMASMIPVGQEKFMIPMELKNATTGTNPDLGWTDIAIDKYGNPILSTNIHSLAVYEMNSIDIPEPSTLALLGTGALFIGGK